MAKKQTTTIDASATNEAPAPAAAEIDPTAYYRVTVTGRFRFSGAGFGPSSTTECTGAILTRLLASEQAGKVSAWAPV